MTKSKIFIGITLFFAAGILVGSIYNIQRQYLYGAAAVCASGLGVFVCMQQKTIALIALFLLAGVFGIWRIHSSQVPSQYAEVLGQQTEMEGYVVEDVDVRSSKQLVTFLPSGHTQRILITSSLAQNYFYGDWVVVSGKITEAKPSQDFDYGEYLKRYNVYGLMSYPKILVLKQHKQNRVVESLYRVKRVFTERLSQFYIEPENSLLLGILIGAKKTLPQSVVDNFNATGTSHIIAISGFNITILVTSLAWLAFVVGRKWAFWISLGIIIAFVLVTGASASVVRAGVMGILLLVAKTIGRQYKITASLFFAGFIMLLINPKILYVDVGFQLSFAATMGIVYFMPQLEKLTVTWKNYLGIKTMLLATLSAIVATSPLLIYNFGSLSLVAPIVNMLVLPFVPLTMLLGFLSVLPFVGPGFAYATHFFLLYTLNITRYFAHIPYASIPLTISLWYFGILCLSVFLFYFIVRHYAEAIPVEAH